MLHIRRLAAIDLAFLGPRIILPEFALGVVGPTVLGIWTLLRSQSAGSVLFGAYLIALGINYVPLLLDPIDIVRRGGRRYPNVKANASTPPSRNSMSNSRSTIGVVCRIN